MLDDVITSLLLGASVLGLITIGLFFYSLF